MGAAGAPRGSRLPAGVIRQAASARRADDRVAYGELALKKQLTARGIARHEPAIIEAKGRAEISTPSPHSWEAGPFWCPTSRPRRRGGIRLARPCDLLAD